VRAGGRASAVNSRSTLRLVVLTPLLVWMSAFAFAACSVQDVVVARESTSALPCASTSDCTLPDEYCAKPFCGSPQGECLLRPVACDDQLQIVCGCDSTIYWNDCLRQRDGVPASTPGQCAPPALCDGTDAGGCLVADAVCGRLLPPGRGPCPPAGQGVCWVLPDTCPEDAGIPLWTSCVPTQPHQPCVDLCTALRSEQPFKRGVGPDCH
jgi:hypothetical protein